VRDGQAAVKKAVTLPQGYRMAWGGEYSQFLEAKSQMYVIGPLAVVLIFMILFALYGNFKFPVTIALGVIMTEPVGALIALKLTTLPFSVSSVLGLLGPAGVSVETAVILVSYINKLRQEGMEHPPATSEASLLRLRPIMMTALVACLGLLPAALSTGIGSDTQSPSPSSSSPASSPASSSDSSSILCCTRWLPEGRCAPGLNRRKVEMIQLGQNLFLA
jgi:heavy metal efflux system protein